MSRKKWITLILCTVLTITGTACGNGDASKVSDSENASASETEQDTGEPAHGQDEVTENLSDNTMKMLSEVKGISDSVKADSEKKRKLERVNQ